MVYTTTVMSSKFIYILSTTFLISGALFAVWQYSNANVKADESDTAQLAGSVASNKSIVHPFLKLYREHSDAVLVDIRTPEEFSSGHLPGAINIDFYNPLFIQSIQQVAEDKILFIYCRSGNRSGTAVRQLSNLGLKVEEMRGGILSYRGELVQN